VGTVLIFDHGVFLGLSLLLRAFSQSCLVFVKRFMNIKS